MVCRASVGGADCNAFRFTAPPAGGWSPSSAYFISCSNRAGRRCLANSKNTRPTMTSDARQRRILSRVDEWSVIAGDKSDVRGWLLQDRWDGLLFDLATRSFNRRLTAALNQSIWVETCMRRHSLGDQVIREDPPGRSWGRTEKSADVLVGPPGGATHSDRKW